MCLFRRDSPASAQASASLFASLPLRPQFLEAARVEGHAQAPALAALGRYFERVEGRGDQAERCFKRALAIDPAVDVAGARRESLEECVGTEE